MAFPQSSSRSAVRCSAQGSLGDLAIIVIDWIRFCRVVRAGRPQCRRTMWTSLASPASRKGNLLRGAANVPPRSPPPLTGDGIAVIVEAILSFVNLRLHRRSDLGRHDRRRPHHHPFRWWVLVFPLSCCFSPFSRSGSLGKVLRIGSTRCCNDPPIRHQPSEPRAKERPGAAALRSVA